MAEWKSDSELFVLVCRELYTPVVGDILDDLGFTRQFLPQPIQPLREEMKLAGRAMPVVMIDVFGKQKKPFGLLTEALDQLQPGEIYLASGGDMRCAYWGEILTATAKETRRCRRSHQRLSSRRHTESARTKLAACIQPWAFCTRLRRPHAGRGLSLHD